MYPANRNETKIHGNYILAGGYIQELKMAISLKELNSLDDHSFAVQKFAIYMYLKSSILKWVYITINITNYLRWIPNRTISSSFTSSLLPAIFWSVVVYFLLYVSDVRSMFPKLD